jgi:hypothetical protein
MPNPLYLEWCREHRRDALQLIDQPVFPEQLLAAANPSDLYLHYLNTYSVWLPECDYQVAVLKPRAPASEFPYPVTGPSRRFVPRPVKRVLQTLDYLRRRRRWRSA